MCSSIDPGGHVDCHSRESKAGTAGKIREARTTPNVPSWNGVDPVSRAKAVGQPERVSSEPSRPRALSNRRLVEASGAPLPKANEGHHGLRRTHGLSAIPRSYRGVSGRGSRGTVRAVANSGDNRFTAGLAAFRAGFIGSQGSRVDGASRFHDGRGPR
jgi:hypothetical protein